MSTTLEHEPKPEQSFSDLKADWLEDWKRKGPIGKTWTAVRIFVFIGVLYLIGSLIFGYCLG